MEHFLGLTLFYECKPPAMSLLPWSPLMRRVALLTCSFLIASLAAASWSAPAEACSCLLLPEAPRLIPGDGGVVPADAEGVAMAVDGSWLEQLSQDSRGLEKLEHARWYDLVEMRRVDRAQRPMPRLQIIPTEYDPDLYLLAPEGGLVPGARYEITLRPPRESDGEPQRAHVEVDTRTWDQVLGQHHEELELGPNQIALVEEPAGVSCSRDVLAAQRRLELTLPPRAERWRDALVHRATVNGQTWAPRQSLCERASLGHSPEGAGRARVHARCDELEASAVDSSRYVRVTATLPGAWQDRQVSAATFVPLSCDPVEARLHPELVDAQLAAMMLSPDRLIWGGALAGWLALLGLGVGVSMARRRRA